MTETHLSQAAYDRLKAELDDLTTRGRTQIAQQIERARELGDLSENGDYHAAKDEQGKMEARIRQIEALLKSAKITEVPDNVEQVHPGSVVTIRYEGDDDTETYLLGSIEERHTDHEVMSANSPLGSAIVGKAVGDVVEYETPTGARLKVEIVSVGA